MTVTFGVLNRACWECPIGHRPSSVNGQWSVMLEIDCVGIKLACIAGLDHGRQSFIHPDSVASVQGDSEKVAGRLERIPIVLSAAC